MDVFYVHFCDGLTSITLIVLTIEQQIKVCVRQIIDNTWKSCHYYSIQVYDNSNMVFRKQLRSMTAPSSVHFILQSWGKLYTIEISTDFQDQVPYTYSKYTCLNEKTNKKGSKIRNPINNVSRYLKDISKIALHLESKKTQKFYK